MSKLLKQSRNLAVLSLCLCLAPFFAAWAENGGLVKIGMLLPLTGDYAVIGSDSRQGFELALDQMGLNSLVELKYSDSRADGSTSVTEFRKLVEQDGVQAVFTFRSPVGKAVNPISRQERVALLGGVGYKEFSEFNPYAFQIWPASDYEGGFMAKQIIGEKLGSIALLTSQDEWTQSVSDGFRKEFSAQGGKLVADLEVVPAESDFRSILTQLREKKAQAIFLNISLAQIAPFVRQARELGFKLPLFSNFWAAKKEVLDALGEEGSEGLMFMEMSTELPQLNSQVKARYNAGTSGATLSGYIAGVLLAQAVKDLKSPPDKEDLYRTLLLQTGVQTEAGNFPVVARRVQFPMALKVIRNGKPVEIRRAKF